MNFRFYPILSLSCNQHFFFFFPLGKRWKREKKEKKKSKPKTWKRRGGLPGGPVNVLTVYPQHRGVVAAACHSQIPSWGPFTAGLCCFLSPGLCSSPFFWLFLASSAHKFLFSLLLSFKQVTARERERGRERELLLCRLSDSTSRPPPVL